MQGRVAIVHDWLASMRGGERVVESLCRIYPQADVFTLHWEPSRLTATLRDRRVTTSFVERFATAPGVRGRFRALLPLFPMAIESFRLGGYSLVLSSSHCVAMGARAPADALHVAYVHSTMRYVHESQPAYEASVPGGALGRFAFRATAQALRTWEAAASARPDVLVANSTYTRDRIRRAWRRESEVIAPPVDTARFERALVRTDPDAPMIVVSALVPNKRVDLAVRAFQGRRERLVVVGEGPERARIERLAGPNVTFRGWVDDAELERLVATSSALVHPAVEDFGMVLVEALAAGKPVIACREGGAVDVVRSPEAGILVDAPTVDAFRSALDRIALVGAFDPARRQAIARAFDRAVFERRILETVEAALQRRDVSGPSRARGRSVA